jgi:hypothetical protein
VPAVLDDLSRLSLRVVGGYADLDLAADPAWARSSVRPLFVTASGMPSAEAADLVRRMTGPVPAARRLRRADTLARTGPPAATMTGRQPG